MDEPFGRCSQTRTGEPYERPAAPAVRPKVGTADRSWRLAVCWAGVGGAVIRGTDTGHVFQRRRVL